MTYQNDFHRLSASGVTADLAETDFGLKHIKKLNIRLRGCLLAPGVVELKNDI